MGHENIGHSGLLLFRVQRPVVLTQYSCYNVYTLRKLSSRHKAKLLNYKIYVTVTHFYVNSNFQHTNTLYQLSCSFYQIVFNIKG